MIVRPLANCFLRFRKTLPLGNEADLQKLQGYRLERCAGRNPAFSAAIRLASLQGSEKQQDHPMCYTAHGERTEDKSKQCDWDGDPRVKDQVL